MIGQTPIPWKIYDDADPHHVRILGRFADIGNAHVADILSPANAELIVRAVNNHEKLVAELRRLFELYGHQATLDVLDAVSSQKEPS